MPIEAKLLRHEPYAKEACPKCGNGFPEFMRGQVQRRKRWLWIGPKRDYCAIICHGCKKVIGWESPPSKMESKKRERALSKFTDKVLNKKTTG